MAQYHAEKAEEKGGRCAALCAVHTTSTERFASLTFLNCEIIMLGAVERILQNFGSMEFSMYCDCSLSDLLEASPFLNMALPWGSLSSLQLSQRSQSDDGPILWVRPGEQLIPTADIGGGGTPRKKRMSVGLLIPRLFSPACRPGDKPGISPACTAGDLKLASFSGLSPLKACTASDWGDKHGYPNYPGLISRIPQTILVSYHAYPSLISRIPQTACTHLLLILEHIL